MVFLDEVTVEVRAGRGGGGAVSFHHEKFRPKMGPGGGDGGRGGDVVLVADPHLRTFAAFGKRRHFLAENGKPGSSGRKAGRHGDPARVCVPLGTVVLDEGGNEIEDLDEPGAERVVARGGAGGRGNARFATASHRAPRESEPGRPGEILKLKLQLRLLADIGIVGFPNAGKSTLLKALCRANVKIADYAFTTREPNLGVLRGDRGEEIVMADIPGLLEGARSGKGLGADFLKHILRTRLILYLLEARDLPAEELLAACDRQWSILRDELEAFSSQLTDKNSIRVVNKIDLVSAPDTFLDEARLREYVVISALTGEGLPALKAALFEHFLSPLGGPAAR